MKVGDLVKHSRSKDYGVIVQIERNRCYRQTIRWKVAWGKWGTVSWIYNENLLEVINESR